MTNLVFFFKLSTKKYSKNLCNICMYKFDYTQYGDVAPLAPLSVLTESDVATPYLL